MDPMSTYEMLRIFLSIAQVIATIAAPFLMVYVDRRLHKRSKDED
jgi:hypothetical protein